MPFFLDKKGRKNQARVNQGLRKSVRAHSGNHPAWVIMYHAPAELVTYKIPSVRNDESHTIRFHHKTVRKMKPATRTIALKIMKPTYTFKAANSDVAKPAIDFVTSEILKWVKK